MNKYKFGEIITEALEKFGFVFPEKFRLKTVDIHCDGNVNNDNTIKIELEI